MVEMSLHQYRQTSPRRSRTSDRKPIQGLRRNVRAINLQTERARVALTSFLCRPPFPLCCSFLGNSINIESPSVQPLAIHFFEYVPRVSEHPHLGGLRECREASAYRT